MPIPELNEEDLERLLPVQVAMMNKIHEHWKYFECALPYSALSGGFHKKAKLAGYTVQSLIDSLLLMGYLQRIPIKSGGNLILPAGVWDQLPVYKQDTWRNPTRLKEAKCAELEEGRKVRLIKSERDVPRFDFKGDPIIVEGFHPAPDKNTNFPVEDMTLHEAIRGILRTSSELEATKGDLIDTIESVRGLEDVD